MIKKFCDVCNTEIPIKNNLKVEIKFQNDANKLMNLDLSICDELCFVCYNRLEKQIKLLFEGGEK